MKRLTTAQFIDSAKLIHGDTYLYDRAEYLTSLQKIIITCKSHGDFLQRPNDHISGGNGCPQCKAENIGNIKRSDTTDVLERFQETHGGRYDYNSVEYTNMKTNVEVCCKKHGPFSISPDKHILGQGCRKCRMSSGEAMVSTVLTELGIEFEIEKTFENLKVVAPLRFDFYLPKLNALVEYDGEQHSTLSKVFRNCTDSSGEIFERFIKTIERDCMKNSFANSNGIYLLRLSHEVRTPAAIKRLMLEFLETVECDPEWLDSSGSYIISSDSLLR